MRLKGEAKSFDIHCMIYESSRLMTKWTQFMKYLDTGFINKLMAHLDNRFKLMTETIQPHNARVLASCMCENGQSPQVPTARNSEILRNKMPIGPTSTTRAI